MTLRWRLFPSGVEGEPEILNGVPALRFELTDLADAVADLGLGFDDTDGFRIENTTAWIADPAGWMVGMHMAAVVDAEQARDLFGPVEIDAGSTAQFTMSLRVLQPNDQALTVNLPDATVTGGSVDEIAVGDCLNTPEDDVFYGFDPIDCTEPHDLEVFALIDLSVVSSEFSTTAPYPGDDAVYDAAIDECWDEFERYVGVPYEDSVLFMDAFTPTLEGWGEFDDRIANCVVFEVNASQTEIVKSSTSLRNAGR